MLDTSTRLLQRARTGAETPEALIFQAMLAGVDFELMEPPELREPLRVISARLQRALEAS